MWKELLFGAGGLFAVVLAAAVTWASKTLIPLVRDWFISKGKSDEWWALRQMVKAAVKGAEKIFAGKKKQGSEKLAYVTDLIEATYKVNEGVLRGLIEEAVDDMRDEQRERDISIAG